jgi:hypothetical protein
MNILLVRLSSVRQKGAKVVPVIATNNKTTK